MNRVQLITAALGDAHRLDYLTLTEGGMLASDRFMAEAEAMISSRLEFYALEYTLTDTDRILALSPIYNQPSRVTMVRSIIRSDGIPLDPVDENVIGEWQSASTVLAYVVRPKTLLFAGTPGATTTFLLQYFGMPAPLLVDTDTNALLNEYPQLYKESIQVSVFKRAQDYDKASAMFQSANALIDEINRKMKKLIGGARSANPYNTTWRSSY
jgi:hypothetical protein